MVGELQLSHCVDFIIIRAISLLRDKSLLNEGNGSRHDVIAAFDNLTKARWKSFSPIFEPHLVMDPTTQDRALETHYDDELLAQLSKQVMLLFDKILSGEIWITGTDEEHLAKMYRGKAVPPGKSGKIPKGFFKQSSWCLYRERSRLVELDEDKTHRRFCYKDVFVPEENTNLFGLLLSKAKAEKRKPGPAKGSIRNPSDLHLVNAVIKIKKKHQEISMTNAMGELRKDPVLAKLMLGRDEKSLNKYLRRLYEKETGKSWT